MLTSLGFKVSEECPKCHADRTLLATTFGLPAYKPSEPETDCKENINPGCVLPIRVILCPRCHLLEIYHDISAKH